MNKKDRGAGIRGWIADASGPESIVMSPGQYVWITSKKTDKDHPLRVELVRADGSIQAINEMSGYSRRLIPGEWRTPQQQTDKMFADERKGT